MELNGVGMTWLDIIFLQFSCQTVSREPNSCWRFMGLLCRFLDYVCRMRDSSSLDATLSMR